MFRKMRRFKQQVSEEECAKILTEEKCAVLSVIGDEGYPYSVPVNFYYDEAENAIYIHGAKSGHKIDAIKTCDKVCFTTWNQGFITEGSWEYNPTSVIAFGRAKILNEISEIEKPLRALATKYFPTADLVEKEFNSPSIKAVQLIKIEIEHMTGKLVNES